MRSGDLFLAAGTSALCWRLDCLLCQGQRGGKDDREEVSLVLVYVDLPRDLGDGFTDQASGTLSPDEDGSELVGGAGSCRLAWGSDT